MNNSYISLAGTIPLFLFLMLTFSVQSFAQSSITVNKTSVPVGLQGFDFNLTGPGTDEDFTLNGGGSEEIVGLAPGMYVVSEVDLPAGFDVEISDITPCGSITTDEPNASADITLPDSCDLSITFTNTGNSTITIAKETVVPDNEPVFDFTSDIPGSTNFSVTNGSDITIMNVPPGTFTIEEEITNGFALTDIDCVGLDFTPNIPARTVTLDIEEDEDVTCTFTNTTSGTIIIEKETVPMGGDGFGFTEDITGEDGEFTLDDGDDEVFLNVAPGEYMVTEQDPVIDPGEFFLTDIVCDDMGSSVDLITRTATIDLDEGEVITCTFTNTTLLGGLDIFKEDSPDPVVAGQNLTYQITVINETANIVEDAIMVDTLPDGVIPVSISSNTMGVECQFDDVEPIEPQTASCDIGNLVPDQGVGITIVVSPDPDVFNEQPEIIENTAVLTALPGPAVRQANTQTLVNPIVDVEINTDRVRREVRREESFDISYDITVNPLLGAVLNSLEATDPALRADALNVLLDIEFSELFEVVSVETTQGVCVVGSIQCSLGNILEGETVTVTVRFRAPDERGEFDIIATVSTLSQSFSNRVVVDVRSGGDGSCALAAPGSSSAAFPLFLLIPLFILFRRSLRRAEGNN